MSLDEYKTNNITYQLTRQRKMTRVVRLPAAAIIKLTKYFVIFPGNIGDIFPLSESRSINDSIHHSIISLAFFSFLVENFFSQYTVSGLFLSFIGIR